VTTHPGEAAPVRIRPAERADLLAVMRIEKASFPQPWPYDAFQRFVGRPGFLVADDRGGGPDGDPVVGYVVSDVIRNYGRPLGHVKDIAVHPDRRGEGIGRALLERALSTLSEARSIKLEVRESNRVAIDLYRDYGFEPLRRRPRYYDDGEDAVVMVREG
jgi:ribosomal-protein-alanine N-acetyltransferase